MAFSFTIDSTTRYPIILLKDVQTGCEAKIYTLGGLLNKFAIPIHGVYKNVVSGYASPEQAAMELTPMFKSAKLSPFVCRLRNGKYTFHQQTFRMEKFYMKTHALHGLVYDAVWEIKETVANSEYAAVTLSYFYAGTDKGYPFPYKLTLKWILQKMNRLSVITTVEHFNNHAIPYADGWHPYFTVGNTIDECILQFDSDTMIEFDEGLIPTGNNIKDSRFKNGVLLEGITLDNCFVLDKVGQPRCVLTGDEIRLIIEPDTSYPFLQIFTPDNRRDIALENISGAPDAFNNNVGLILLEPGKPKSFITTYLLEIL